MGKIAVDVALLLPDAVNKICVEINRRKDADPESDLSKSNNYPHITLSMGVIEQENLPLAEAALKETCRDFTPLQIEIPGIDYGMTPENRKSYGFAIRPADELKRLHSAVMKSMHPLFSYAVANDMFFVDTDEIFSDVSRHWVENYGKDHMDANNYHPHISLKCRKADYTHFPIKFSATKLGIFHLGNYCTCREAFSIIDL